MDISIDQDIGVVTVKGKKYAVNLIWNIVENEEDFIEVIKVETEQLGSNLFCKMAHLEGGICYGLADVSLGHSSGMSVLPAVISSLFDSSLIGAWHLDNDVWYIIAIDSTRSILIDKAFYKEDEAFDKFSSIQNHMSCSEIICPASWDWENSKSNFILDNLPDKKQYKIISRKLNFQFKFLLYILAFSLAITIAFYLKSNFHIKKPKKYNTHEVIEKYNPFPAENDILPRYFIKNCQNTILEYLPVAFSLPGYRLNDAAVCTVKSVNFTLTRLFGSSDYIPKNIKSFIKNQDGYIDISDENFAKITLPLQGKKIGDIDDANMSLSLNNIHKMFDNAFIRIQTSNKRPCGIKSDYNTVYNRSFVCVKFRIATKYNPELLIPIFDKNRNLTIKKMSYNISASSWLIEGVYFGIGQKNPNNN
ncbi:hypothetical protein SAMN05216516_102280 [Izhakiella capsodis]|uniref:Pilin accessory protein (PilO) n=1 Tax=Izhakiella capsodis TaxID=1367852 RepID=A0A1I4W4J9_9GAMM|nr:hypothetical protein [Izhakiella capsodis]SFN08362.1 hypothetical protein SAMN05216516_102280 [Izhakiella capsodis]